MEEILLFILDAETGKLANVDSQELNYALAGAVLMDLALRSKIDADLQELVLLDSTLTGEELLDPYLKMISSENRTHITGYWVNKLAKHGPEIMEEALSTLLKRGILKLVEKKIFLVFETKRYLMVNRTEEKEVKERILDLLMSDDIPTPHDVVLINLADACGLLTYILGPRKVVRLAPRIEQITRLDLIGHALSQLLKRHRIEAKLLQFPSV